MSFSQFTFSQCGCTRGNRAEFGKNFRVFLGFNAVNNSNERSPFKGVSDWAVGIPISFGVESTFKRNLVFEQSFSVNKFKETNSYNGSMYYSASSTIMYFLDDLIKSEKLEIFVSAGIGVFNIQKTNTSGNLGGGLQYWINDNMAIRFKSIAKLALKAHNADYGDSHFQNHLELVYRL